MERSSYALLLVAIFIGLYQNLDTLLGTRYGVKGKCAVVTGASSGIGVSIAEALAEEGVSKIIVAARRFKKLSKVAETMKRKYPNTETIAVKVDVLSKSDRVELRKIADEKFGDKCVTILVNNAGVEYWHPFETLPDEKLDQQINVNLLSLMKMTKDFLPRILKARAGHIVNIASQAALFAVPYGQAYAASKAGVRGFTKGIRAEFRHRGKITVGVVLPGYISNTGMYADMQKNSEKKGFENLDEYVWYNKYFVGSSDPYDSSKAVIDSIKYDVPEVNVNYLFGANINRLHSTISEIFPRVWDWVLPNIMVKPVEFTMKLAKLRETEDTFSGK